MLEVRLKEGTENATFLEGRVEVKYRLRWGLVCDDGWDLKDAQVVCRMLGYDKALEASSRAKYGTGSGSLGIGKPKIILDEVNCKGSETTLADCQHSGFKDHNCKPDEAAGAACGKEGRIEENGFYS